MLAVMQALFRHRYYGWVVLAAVVVATGCGKSEGETDQASAGPGRVDAGIAAGEHDSAPDAGTPNGSF